MNMSKLAETILTAMQNTASKATPVTMVIASVVTPPPNLTIKFGENVIPSNQVYCSNYLLPHYHRDYTISGTVDEIKLNLHQLDINNTTTTDVSSCSVGAAHVHPISSISGTKGTDSAGKLEGRGSYETHGDLWFEDTLQTGDEVLTCLVGIYWVVVTKITKMPNNANEGV